MNRRHRSWWDVIADTTSRAIDILLAREYCAIELIIVSAITVTIGVLIGRAT